MSHILAVSDVELGILYSGFIGSRFSSTDIVISCGDLPMFYLDYIASLLNVPLYFVYGNHHCTPVLKSGHGTGIVSGTNLHRTCAVNEDGLLLAGVEGCIRYNDKEKQYTQNEMWWHVFSLVPQLFLNKMRYGRFLDVFVTHAPPWEINAGDDHVHAGIKAFRWLDQSFSPAMHLHGHVHLYRNNSQRVTPFNNTQVINVFGYQELTWPINHTQKKPLILDKKEPMD